MTDNLHTLAAAKRDEAVRARRLGHGLSVEADREKVLLYARELDAEAAVLEGKALAGTTPGRGPVRQEQREQQQQGKQPPRRRVRKPPTS